jgi:O-antigen/teichoic acid export membrane protein
MLKRIFVIALLTGAGQVFVVFALKYISQNSSPEQVKAIGQIDSLIVFIMNVIALGLQPATMRDLALTDNWKQDYIDTQSARLTLSFFLVAFTLLAFVEPYYLIFFIAPLLALSGDYALYGRGYPVKGAIIALLRAIIPFSILIVFTKIDPSRLGWMYMLSMMLIYIITNSIISAFLKTSNFVRPQLNNLKLYLQSLPLGAVALSIYILGLGLALVTSYFYSAPVVAITYIGFKFYVIFKGVLRVLHQAFVKDMTDDKISLKIDQLSSLVGLSLAAYIIIFPTTFISFFFGKQYISEITFFILIGISAFIYSLFASITTTSLLERKDLRYSLIYTIASLIAVLMTMFFSIKYNTPVVISISLLAGECIFTILAFIFLSSKKFIKDRLLFYLKNFLFILIPLGFRLFFSDDIFPFIISGILFFAAIAISYFKKFSLLS